MIWEVKSLKPEPWKCHLLGIHSRWGCYVFMVRSRVQLDISASNPLELHMYQQNKNCNRRVIPPLSGLPRTPNLSKVLSIPKAGCYVFRVLLCQMDPPNRKDLLLDLYCTVSDLPSITNTSCSTCLRLIYPALSPFFCFNQLLLGGGMEVRFLWHNQQTAIGWFNSPKPSHDVWK
jgi:hypothetical protein